MSVLVNEQVAGFFNTLKADNVALRGRSLTLEFIQPAGYRGQDTPEFSGHVLPEEAVETVEVLDTGEYRCSNPANPDPELRWALEAVRREHCRWGERLEPHPADAPSDKGVLFYPASRRDELGVFECALTALSHREIRWGRDHARFEVPQGVTSPNTARIAHSNNSKVRFWVKTASQPVDLESMSGDLGIFQQFAAELASDLTIDFRRPKADDLDRLNARIEGLLGCLVARCPAGYRQDLLDFVVELGRTRGIAISWSTALPSNLVAAGDRVVIPKAGLLGIVDDQEVMSPWFSQPVLRNTYRPKVKPTIRLPNFLRPNVGSLGNKRLTNFLYPEHPPEDPVGPDGSPDPYNN